MTNRLMLLATCCVLAVAGCRTADLARATDSAPATDSPRATTAIRSTSTPTNATGSAYGPGPVYPTQEARVVRVADGDTIEVEFDGRQRKVRYIGIDAPELGGERAAPEPLGREALEANRDLVEQRTVYLEKDVSEVDQFGRLLRYVWLLDANGWLLVNEDLVRQGLADSHHYAINQMYIDRLDAAEDDARAAQRGIWADDHQQP